LNIDNIIEAAKRSGADAIHPVWFFVGECSFFGSVQAGRDYLYRTSGLLHCNDGDKNHGRQT